MITTRLAALLALLAAPSAFAASQSWTNAPVSGAWDNTNNWVARAIPGALNSTGNGNNNDTATFTNALFGAIGGAGIPIVPDDATVAGARSRSIGTVLFDTSGVGAYVFESPSPAVLAAAGVPETGYLNVGHNNAIRMNASVNNSQVFHVPLKVLLPSSTAGIFNLVNNSTNPSATLTISSIRHGGADTRATTYVLDGVNTGDNVVTNLSEGTGNATGGFTKQGAGTWIIRGTSVFPGASPLNINAGTLAVQVADAFGAATTATVTNTGVLRLDGVTLNQASINLRNGGNIRANGTAGINGVAVGAQAATTATLSTTSASDEFTVGTGFAAGALVTGGAADTVLNTAGPGTLIFSQANTYVGRWSFNAKTNQILNPSALGTGLNANVGAGAILDLTPLGGSSFVPTTAGFGGSGTGVAVGTTAAAVLADPSGTLDLTSKNVNLTFTPTAFSGDTTHPALYMAQGTLALGNNTFFINNASGTPLGVGTYRLIQQASGSITSGGGYAALISGSGTVGGTAAAIVVSGGNVDLVISIYVPKNLVWSGTGANWDVGSTVDWLNGVTPSVFNNSDNVTFNSVGAANPSVNLIGTLAPATVVVNTSANDYTFGGSGQVGGATALTKLSAGVLNLNTVNTYAGGTVVSNGTLRVGVNNAIPSVGAGDVAVYGSGVIDLNNFTDTINALSGNGTVDNQGGGAATLSVGNNNNSGTFTGVIKNTSGTLALTKLGNGSLTLNASNSYAGGTTVNGGTLAIGNPHALGTNVVNVNTGTLDVKTDLHVGSLAGTGGTIANNSTATTNTIFVEGGAATTAAANIVDGSGGGGIAVKILNASSLTLSGISTYTGGTYVGTNSTFAIPNAPAGVGGFVIASNNATLALSGGSGTPGTPVSVTTVPGATVSFTSGALGKIWAAQFVGAANSTNRILNPISFGGDTSFKDFLGVVQFEATGNARFINIPANTAGGSDNTTFDFVGATAVVTRDAATVRLGHIRGGSSASGIDGATTAGVIDTYVIGGKNVDSIFAGYFRGSNNLVKIGSARLVFNGLAVTTNTDSATYTNYTFGGSLVSHTLPTTISNGTLVLVAPNNLSNSPSITLAGTGATLNALAMGYVSNYTDINGDNSVLLTNGLFEVHADQTLNGFGSILGSVTTDPATTVNVGLPVGVLNVSGSISLNGIVNMDLNRGNSPTADRINAASFSGSGATLNITNLGANLVTGDTFQLFSGPVTAFSAVNLPVATADNSITYVWENNIAVNGSIKVLSGASPVNPTPTNITSTVVGNTLQLSWPSSHTGWTLQAQTNALNVGLSGTWFPVAGSTTTNQVFVPINPGNPTVFYRLTLPTP